MIYTLVRLWLAPILILAWAGAAQAQPTPHGSRAAAHQALQRILSNPHAQPHLIGGESLPADTNVRLYFQSAFPGQTECRTLLHNEARLTLPEDDLLMRHAYRGLTSTPLGLDWRDVAAVERRGPIVTIHRPQSYKAEANIRFQSEAAAERAAAAMSFLRASCDDTAEPPSNVDHAHRILARSLASGFRWSHEGDPRAVFMRLFRLWTAVDQCMIRLHFRSAGGTLEPEPVRFNSNMLRAIARNGGLLELTFEEEHRPGNHRVTLELPNPSEAARAERALDYMRTNACPERAS